MKIIDYIPQNVCSRHIHIEMSENDVIESVCFVGGCNGNLQGICHLVQGMKKNDVISRLKGIKCGNKCTSCPDQLCHALESSV